VRDKAHVRDFLGITGKIRLLIGSLQDLPQALRKAYMPSARDLTDQAGRESGNAMP
jgi:hypothetical protein